MSGTPPFDDAAPLVGRLGSPVGGAGVEAWSVFVSWSRGLTLAVKDGHGGGAHTPARLGEATGLHYKIVWDDGRLSRGRLERAQYASPEAIETSLLEARASAFDDPDAVDVAAPAGAFPSPRIFDAAAAEGADGDAAALQERRGAVERRIEALDAGYWSGSFWARRGAARLWTSRGIDVEGGGTRTGWSAWIDGRMGDAFDGRALDDERAFAARFDRLERLARAAAREAPAFEAGSRTVWLAPAVVERLVLGTLFQALGGASVAHGEGAFKKEDFGADRAVLREDCSLAFDPTLDDRVGSYRFTAEGVPAAPTPLIRHGRLVQPLLDLKYARVLGGSPTALPQGDDTYDFRLGAPIDETAAYARAAGGVEVRSVLGLHTLDGSSGDFSLSAPHALVLGVDGPEGRRACTFSGNLYDALRDPRTYTVRVPGETLPAVVLQASVQARENDGD